MFDLHKIMGVSHVVAFPIAFLFIYECGWEGGVFIALKIHHFLIQLAVWVLFAKFLGI